jgi:sigma-B regulation protein RsbU (phosphoserine phosphatase)
MATMQTKPPAPPAEPTVPMQCMEIWGGIEGANEYVTVPGIDAWVYAEPHAGSDRGGDIHYLSLCGGGNISRFMVADVAGHGHSVAEVAHQFRKLMRKHINTPNQAHFAQSLNESFGQDSASGQFATALMATYFAPNDHLIMVNAGHPRPLRYSAQAGQWGLLSDESACCVHKVSAGLKDLPLGVLGETHYTQFAVPLGKGDLVIIYTDSLIEACNASGEQLGQEGLLDLARRHCTGEPHRLGRRLLDAVQAYRGGGPSDDDVTLIVLHHNASDPPAHSLGDWVKVMAKMAGLVKV